MLSPVLFPVFEASEPEIGWLGRRRIPELTGRSKIEVITLANSGGPYSVVA